jgi:hypothetical protein
MKTKFTKSLLEYKFKYELKISTITQSKVRLGKVREKVE